MKEKFSNTIVAIHLFNGYTGSPKILFHFIRIAISQGKNVSIISSFNNEGFLSDLKDVKKINIYYLFFKNKILRFINFFLFQLISSFNLFRFKPNGSLLINTIQPVLPALVGRILGYNVILYLHEVYPINGLFNKILFSLSTRFSNRIICVSNYVFNSLDAKFQDKSVVINNCIDIDFFPIKNKKEVVQLNINSKRNVLMVSSLKSYKGIFEFIEVAKLMSNFDFTLILSESQTEIDLALESLGKIKNLSVFPMQKNLDYFYMNCDLILNLTKVDMIIESFGMTILEAMKYGKPAIVPPIGGVAELVEEGINGFKVDSRDLNKLQDRIDYVLSNQSVYNKMSIAAFEKAKLYSLDNYKRKLIEFSFF